MTIRIGITGPIGCGKSTIGGWLRDLGATVIDADAEARSVVEPGEPALDAVFEAFGPSVRAADGSLDRGTLGRIVFSDPAALVRLEAITHPAVRTRILAAIEAAAASRAPAVAIEAIKLVEGGLAALCDEIWLVTCSEASQRTRLTVRGTAPEDAEARIAAQAGMRERVRTAATRVIDTDSDLADTRLKVIAAYGDALGAGGSERSLE